MTAVTAAVASTDSLWYMSGTDASYCFFWCHTHDLCSTRVEPSTSWHLYPSTLTRCSCLHHLFHVLILTAHGVCDPKQKSCSQDNYYTFTNSSTQSDLQPMILLMALLSITLNLNSAYETWIIFSSRTTVWWIWWRVPVPHSGWGQGEWTSTLDCRAEKHNDVWAEIIFN